MTEWGWQNIKEHKEGEKVHCGTGPESLQSLWNEQNLFGRDAALACFVEGREVCRISLRVDVSRWEENKAAEREGLGFITARSTHHAGSHTGEQAPLSGWASPTEPTPTELR